MGPNDGLGPRGHPALLGRRPEQRRGPVLPERGHPARVEGGRALRVFCDRRRQVRPQAAASQYTATLPYCPPALCACTQADGWAVMDG